MRFKKIAAACAISCAGLSAQAATVLSEGFDSLATAVSSGWLTVNQSPEPGASWLQGNPTIFAAASGAANSYASAGYLSTGSAAGGPISNWLMTPHRGAGQRPACCLLRRPCRPPVMASSTPIEVRLSTSGAQHQRGRLLHRAGQLPAASTLSMPGSALSYGMSGITAPAPRAGLCRLPLCGRQTFPLPATTWVWTAWSSRLCPIPEPAYLPVDGSGCGRA